MTIVGALAALALAIMAPAASAGMVTKIMYAQENSDVYAYTNSSGSTGTLSVSIGWTDISTGVATTYPVGEVDGDIFSGPADTPYADLGLTVSSVQTLDAGTNPEVGSYSLPAGQTAYIAVLPYAGDNNYSIYVYFNGVLVSGYPKTAQAYGSNGEVYVPSDGDWISCAQYWPGGGTSPLYASWTDQVYQRVAPGTTFDVLSAQLSAGFTAPQITQRTVIGGSGHPQSAEWYGVTPQIWPGAKVANTVVNGVPQPGTVSATTAPLWYTYSYPDASVSGSPVAYFWPTLTSASASKRNFSADVSTGASFSAKFSGDSITWVYEKLPTCGIASVAIDGTSRGTVDQYSSSPVYKASTTWSGLGAGNHTIVVTNSKSKDTASNNTFLTHDAFLADGVNDASDPTPALENNYDGATTYQWAKLTSTSASGGNYSADVSTAAAAAFEFTGTSVTWKYTKLAVCGIANVYIDGILQGQVDQYSASPTYQASTTYSGLANTTHILLVTNSKTKDTASSNTFLTVDAFVVGSTTYEN